MNFVDSPVSSDDSDNSIAEEDVRNRGALCLRGSHQDILGADESEDSRRSPPGDSEDLECRREKDDGDFEEDDSSISFGGASGKGKAVASSSEGNAVMRTRNFQDDGKTLEIADGRHINQEESVSLEGDQVQSMGELGESKGRSSDEESEATISKLRRPSWVSGSGKRRCFQSLEHTSAETYSSSNEDPGSDGADPAAGGKPGPSLRKDHESERAEVQDGNFQLQAGKPISSAVEESDGKRFRSSERLHGIGDKMEGDRLRPKKFFRVSNGNNRVCVDAQQAGMPGHREQHRGSAASKSSESGATEETLCLGAEKQGYSGEGTKEALLCEKVGGDVASFTEATFRGEDECGKATSCHFEESTDRKDVKPSNSLKRSTEAESQSDSMLSCRKASFLPQIRGMSAVTLTVANSKTISSRMLVASPCASSQRSLSLQRLQECLSVPTGKAFRSRDHLRWRGFAFGSVSSLPPHQPLTSSARMRARLSKERGHFEISSGNRRTGEGQLADLSEHCSDTLAGEHPPNQRTTKRAIPLCLSKREMEKMWRLVNARRARIRKNPLFRFFETHASNGVECYFTLESRHRAIRDAAFWTAERNEHRRQTEEFFATQMVLNADYWDNEFSARMRQKPDSSSSSQRNDFSQGGPVFGSAIEDGLSSLTHPPNLSAGLSSQKELSSLKAASSSQREGSTSTASPIVPESQDSPSKTKLSVGSPGEKGGRSCSAASEKRRRKRGAAAAGAALTLKKTSQVFEAGKGGDGQNVSSSGWGTSISSSVTQCFGTAFSVLRGIVEASPAASPSKSDSVATSSIAVADATKGSVNASASCSPSLVAKDAAFAGRRATSAQAACASETVVATESSSGVLGLSSSVLPGLAYVSPLPFPVTSPSPTGADSSLALQMQKDDTLLWCSQQVSLVEVKEGKKVEAAYSMRKGAPFFHQVVLADAQTTGMGGGRVTSPFCLLNVDRIPPPRELDEILIIMAVLAKTYIAELATAASKIEGMEFERKAASATAAGLEFRGTSRHSRTSPRSALCFSSPSAPLREHLALGDAEPEQTHLKLGLLQATKEEISGFRREEEPLKGCRGSLVVAAGSARRQSGERDASWSFDRPASGKEKQKLVEDSSVGNGRVCDEVEGIVEEGNPNDESDDWVQEIPERILLGKHIHRAAQMMLAPFE